MPTLLIQDGFKFFFYANEHLPCHIHVVKGGNYAKIELENLTVVENYFSNAELNKVLSITKENKEIFIRKWNEYFKR
jgi:hypothetical protein